MGSKSDPGLITRSMGELFRLQAAKEGFDEVTFTGTDVCVCVCGIWCVTVYVCVIMCLVYTMSAYSCTTFRHTPLPTPHETTSHYTTPVHMLEVYRDRIRDLLLDKSEGLERDDDAPGV
jgi:hypothetical protein